MAKYIYSNYEKRTRRLIIRSYKASDYQSWKDAFSDPSVPCNDYEKRIHKDKKNLTRSSFKRIIQCQKEHQNNDTFYDFAVFERKSERLIGFVNIMGVQRVAWQKADLGYLLFSKHWGKGYGTEMLKAAIAIAFKELKLHRLEAAIRSENIPSIALAKRAGMRFENVRANYIFNGKFWENLEIFTISSEDIGVKWKRSTPAKSYPRL